MKYLPVLFLMVSYSCSEPEVENNNPLLGEWQLIEILSDPGNGSGVFVPVESDKYLLFNSDNVVNTNGSFCRFGHGDVGDNDSGEYSIETNMITPVDCLFDFGGIRFELNDSVLELSYLCDEACLEKYIVKML